MSSLFSAFILEAGMPMPRHNVELFTYGQGQHVSGTDQVAQRYHTNVPRGSDSGLPMGWAMQVDRWRAATNLRFLVDPVLEWASEVSVEFVMGGGWSMQRTPLVDLLMAPQPLSDPRDEEYRARRLREGQAVAPKPLILSENIGFRVVTQHHSEVLHNHLMNYLVEHAIDLKSSGEALGDKIARPRLTCWIWLEGVLVRS